MKFTALLFSLMIFLCLQLKAQTFDLYIANDTPTDSATYEFDVMIRSTTATTWAIRTVQLSFFVNPLWLSAGPDPTITYIGGTSTLMNYTPGPIQMNASPNSLSAFQVAGNLGVSCISSSQFTTNGQIEKVGRFRILSNSGAMNCVPVNLSMIQTADVSPGGNVNLKVNVTAWNDATCIIGTQSNITGNGIYTSIANSTLLNAFNNIAPTISVQPIDTAVTDCDSTQFMVSASPVVGQTGTVSYQWYENGAIIGNNAIFSGVNDDTLTITHPPATMNGNLYFVVVSECGTHMSNFVMLSVNPCTTGISETEDDLNISIFPNPTKGKINIQNLSDFKPSRIEIINSLSQVVYHSDYISKKGIIKEMDLNLPEGIYFVRFYSVDRYVQRRIVVQ